MATMIAPLALTACQTDSQMGFTMQDDCSVSHWEAPMRAPVDEGNGYVSLLYVFAEDDPSNHTKEGFQSFGRIKNCTTGETIEAVSYNQNSMPDFFARLRQIGLSSTAARTLARNSDFDFEVNELAPDDGSSQTSCACQLYYPGSLGATQ